jgi:hypothetical protein
MIQDLYDSFYKAVKKEAEWLYKGNSDEFIDSQAVRNIAHKMLCDMEDIMRKEFYERHREWERKKLLERIVAFKKKPIKSVDWLQYPFDAFSEGKYVAFLQGNVNFFTLMDLTGERGYRTTTVTGYLNKFIEFLSKKGYMKDKRYACVISNSIDNSLMEILEEEGCYEISFAGKTLKFSIFEGSKYRIGEKVLSERGNPCRCCLLDVTETN